MSAHARYSPSSTDRWMECPGSVQLCAKAPERKDSRAAAEGTNAHTCLEILLKNGPSKFRETLVFLNMNLKHDAEMIFHAHNTAKFLWGYRGKRRLESEKKVYLPHVDKDLWGTLDVTISEPFGLLEILDFKYGKFVPVDVEKNSQLLTYAVGEAHRRKYNFEAIRLTVIQPRAPHEKGPVRSWDTGIETVKAWEDKLRTAIAKTKQKNPPLKAGEHCFFCDAKTICPAYTPDATAAMKNRIVSSAIEAAETPETPESRQNKIEELFGPKPKKRAREPW